MRLCTSCFRMCCAQSIGNKHVRVQSMHLRHVLLARSERLVMLDSRRRPSYIGRLFHHVIILGSQKYVVVLCMWGIRLISTHTLTYTRESIMCIYLMQVRFLLTSDSVMSWYLNFSNVSSPYVCKVVVHFLFHELLILKNQTCTFTLCK